MTGCAKKDLSSFGSWGDILPQVTISPADPSSLLLERYVDVDLMDNKEPTKVSMATHGNLAVCGMHISPFI